MENVSMNEQDKHIRGALEAILFVSENPITIDDFKRSLETVAVADIRRVLQILKDEYDQRESGMNIVEIAGGYQLLSTAQYAPYIRNFFKSKHKERLSKPALETLAIVAYKQPVTRSDIEIIRGVNSDGVFNHLLSKDLIKIVGRKDVAGRPFLYGTTKQFLEYFGLKSLEDLPRLEEFPNLKPVEQQGMLAIEGSQEAGESATEIVAEESSIKPSEIAQNIPSEEPQSQEVQAVDQPAGTSL